MGGRTFLAFQIDQIIKSNPFLASQSNPAFLNYKGLLEQGDVEVFLVQQYQYDSGSEPLYNTSVYPGLPIYITFNGGLSPQFPDTLEFEIQTVETFDQDITIEVLMVINGIMHDSEFLTIPANESTSGIINKYMGITIDSYNFTPLGKSDFIDGRPLIIS